MTSDASNPAARLELLVAMDSTVPTASRTIEDEVVVLFDELRDSLLRYVVSFGIKFHDGEDVIQEVFLSLFKHLRLGRSRKNLRGWVFRVAHNLALKQRQRLQRRQAKIVASEGIIENRLDPLANPEEQCANIQRRKRLFAVVATLSEEDQSCLRLRAEGLRYREIADALNMSLGAVSNSLVRSTQRLFDAGGE